MFRQRQCIPRKVNHLLGRKSRASTPTTCARRQSSSPSSSPFVNFNVFTILVILLFCGCSWQATAASSVATTTSAAAASKVKKKDDIKAYRLQQQLLLSSRSLILRQALLQRGVDALQHGSTGEGGGVGGSSSSAVKKWVDWDCALATEENPKSCLYSFDAEPGSKVIAPLDTDQWITLSALNRLRRTDPTKVEPLWHSQYYILQNWFHPDNSKYSLYTHLTLFPGAVLSLLLDAPVILACALLVVMVIVFLITLPVWEQILQAVLTHPTLWLQWPNWGRFVHAALPLKLLLGQMAWNAVSSAFGKVYDTIRKSLVEWECQIMEDCIPLTVLDGDEGAAAAYNVDIATPITSNIMEENAARFMNARPSFVGRMQDDVAGTACLDDDEEEDDDVAVVSESEFEDGDDEDDDRDGQDEDFSEDEVDDDDED